MIMECISEAHIHDLVSAFATCLVLLAFGNMKKIFNLNGCSFVILKQ